MCSYCRRAVRAGNRWGWPWSGAGRWRNRRLRSCLCQFAACVLAKGLAPRRPAQAFTHCANPITACTTGTRLRPPTIAIAAAPEDDREFAARRFARGTQDHIERIIWHPLALSRTDVRPSPSPLIVVWGGPVFGSSAPLLAMFISSKMRWRFNYILAFFAGFCLLANGLYIGVGAVNPIGDAHEMLRLGTPRWVLATFGLTTIIGMWIFERVSTKLGFGLNSEAIVTRKAYGTFLAAFLLTCIGIAVGNHGY